MGDELPRIYLARHGETAWTVTGQHTGHVDLPLTEHGESQAGKLSERLRTRTYAKVFTSPLHRARRTCELAGFGQIAEIDPDLIEWDYGRYEGLLNAEILKERPGWQMFRDGYPSGETPVQVAARADRVAKRVRAVGGDVLLFSSGDFLKVLASRWIGMDVIHGGSFLLNTASISTLAYANSLEEPVIQVWNDTCHLETRTCQADSQSR